MQPGHVSRDSIARCKSEDHLYAAIRNPMAKKSAPVSKVDTIESIRAKKENHALEKLRSMHLPNATLIVIASAGKFVFLAIVLPPYIVFYGVPKWLITEACPFLLQFTFTLFKKPLEKIKKSFKPINNHITNAVRNTLTALKVKGAEYIQWINRTTKTLFVHLKHQVVSRAYRLMQPFLPSFKNGFKAAEKVSKLLQAKTNKHSEVALKFVSLGWQTLKNEVANHFRPYAELAAKKYNQAKKNITNRISRVTVKIDNFKTNIAKRLRKTTEVLSATGLKIAKPFIKVAEILTLMPVPMISWLKQRYQQSKVLKNKVVDPFRVPFEKVKGLIQNVALAVVDMARYVPQVIVNTAMRAFEAINLSGLKKFFNRDGGFKQRSHDFFEGMRKGLSKFAADAARFIVVGWLSALKQGSEWVDKLMRFLSFIVNEIRKLPGRLLSLTKYSYKMGIYSLVKLGSALHLLGFWSRVFLRFGWQEMRTLSASLAESIRLRRLS